jgi:hypothetical protein
LFLFFNTFTFSLWNNKKIKSVLFKEIVERIHGESIKFLFLPKMCLLGNYGNPYQDTQNWLQIRWHKSGITWIWAMLSLLRVLRHLLLNGIGRIQKFDS